jgi:cell division protein FtsQ
VASNSGRRSGSSGRSSSRKRVVIGAEETVRVKYKKKGPEVEAERKRAGRAGARSGESGKPKPRARTAAARAAADKRDERERRRRSDSRRRFLLYAAAVVAVALVLWAGWAVWNSDAFSASDVQVTGAKHLSSAEVIRLAAISASDTLPNLRKKELEKRIQTSPWVESVSITRRLPHTVVLAVTERTPAAVAETGGGAAWLVSADGHWIAPRTADATQPLTPIRELPAQKPVAGQQSTSVELRNALLVLAGLSPQMKARLKSISAPTLEKTALILKGDIQVFVGSADQIDQKDTRARFILGQEKNVVYINVRTVDRPVWRGLAPKN